MSVTLYQLPGPWKGCLAIASRPRGGDWLADDLKALGEAGVDVLLSTLTANERVELGLTEEEELARRSGLEYVSFPIDDRGVPASVPAAAELVARIRSRLNGGETVAIHCRSGIGRSSLLAAAMLAASGVDWNLAFQRIETARGLSVPDTPEQKEWVRSFLGEAVSKPERAAS